MGEILIGYFLDSNIPQAVVKSITLKIWRKHNLMDVIPIGDGFFMFKFFHLNGAKDVLESGRWLIAGRYLVLRWWSTGLSLTKAALTSIPVWVQLCGVALEYWTAEGLSHIASVVGVPLYADAQTEQGTHLKYARICVEVDASKPLIEEIFLKPNSKGTASSPPLIRIKALYQWKPKRCSGCQVFGHTDTLCPQQIATPANQPNPPELGQASGSTDATSGKT